MWLAGEAGPRSFGIETSFCVNSLARKRGHLRACNVVVGLGESEGIKDESH